MTDTRIEFEAVQPDASRRFYKHAYGLRGITWDVRGSYERTYYFDPAHLSGVLRKYLPQTIVSLAAVIQSEIEAAIDQQMKPQHQDAVNEFLAWQREQRRSLTQDQP